MDDVSTPAKPFLKWAGGKGQLIEQMSARFPAELRRGEIHTYVEPFLGGGAPFFHISKAYDVERHFISDINDDLILIYRTIQQEVDDLVAALYRIQAAYYELSPEEQKRYFYRMRSKFNRQRQEIDLSRFCAPWVERSAQAIFLNKTCFNGLFRFNAKNEFNASFGRYDNPLICDEPNLLNVSKVLQGVTIRQGDFACCESLVSAGTFVYLDPPYRPLSKTASFTSYSARSFNDRGQLRLASFFRQLDETGARLMLSNSDSRNGDKDSLLEDVYQGFRIDRVRAKRSINSKADKRGEITELLIMNY